MKEREWQQGGGSAGENGRTGLGKGEKDEGVKLAASAWPFKKKMSKL